MSLIHELYDDVLLGVRDGRRQSIEHKESLAYHAALKEPNYSALGKPAVVADLPSGVLGVTELAPNGAVGNVYVAKSLANIGLAVKNAYDLTVSETRKFVRYLASLVTMHEDAHAVSSNLIIGEGHNSNSTKVLETVTTYALAQVLKDRGRHKDADSVKKMNPYPAAWLLGLAADKLPYSSESGTGYRAFMRDAQQEPFRKPLWRLAKAAARASWKKAAEMIEPRDAPAYAYT